ncbi:glycogen debranching N-terminal domain-containing protein [Plantactinospora solaniradicis]|uniref:Glycogen debranching N-terminal domain-containing protein n=1 Tax=Plantactinospora solaniradicis TaxID=1723736 RepID=A0ABW1KK42_9ACTN
MNGAPPLVLSSCIVDHYSAAFFLANPELPGLAADTIGIRRQRFVGEGVHERIELQCFGREPRSFELRLAVGNDFADLFEIKTTTRFTTNCSKAGSARTAGRSAGRLANPSGTWAGPTGPARRMTAGAPANAGDGWRRGRSRRLPARRQPQASGYGFTDRHHLYRSETRFRPLRCDFVCLG